ncbi:MAG: hypothetical protein ACREID_08405, partial [Planctomycetota bacterium]
MTALLRDAFPFRAPALAAAALLVAAPLAFLRFVLEPGPGRAFAGMALALTVAAAAGPFLYERRDGDARWAPAARGALRSLMLGLLGALLTGGAAVSWICALYGFTAGAAGDALGALFGRKPGRLLAGAFGLLLLGTLLYWDRAFLARAADPKTSAALAFRLNALAAASVSMGFDWIHAKA